MGELFSDSLGEVITISPTEIGNKKWVAPIIPMINKRKKVVIESSDTTAQSMTSSTEQAGGA